MFNFDHIIKEDIKQHKSNWPQIPDHPYRIRSFGNNIYTDKINIDETEMNEVDL